VIKPLALYSLGRLAAVAMPLLLLWALGVSGFPALLIALVISVPLSFFVLRRQREDVAAAVYRRTQRTTAEREQLPGD
jgi:fatty acid desaturase